MTPSSCRYECNFYILYKNSRVFLIRKLYFFLNFSIKSYSFQSVLESLPGVDPQSDAMRQAMGALTGSAKKDEPKDEKKNDDKDKKQNEGESVDLATKL